MLSDCRDRFTEGRCVGLLVAGLLALACVGCAAPIQRMTTTRSSAPETDQPPRLVREATRPTVGVAFGGGSARGIAHVGVIRWLEEHRIPIDVAAGTSIGGLVGGAYATGMEPDELQTFITQPRLGSSCSARRRSRTRTSGARPMRARIPSPPRVRPQGRNCAADRPQQRRGVELLLGRIAAPYFDMKDFDDLPTRSGRWRSICCRRSPSSCAAARWRTRCAPRCPCRSSFRPTQVNGQVLIDGGTMDNVPADVVKAMGASHVIAVNVGDLSDREGVSYTMFGVAGVPSTR